MKMEDMILVSVDDHIIEPPEVFANHVPEKYKSRAPRLERTDEGRDRWIIDGNPKLAFGAMSAVVGRVPDEYGHEPANYEQMRKGCYDVHARVEDMNVNGVLGSLNFGSFPGFCGETFFRMEDKELALILVKAYNDWHIDEWCGAYPDRMIPQAVVPIWDPELCAEEIRRTAAKGCHAVTFSDNPAFHGFPGLHREEWNPFWEACVENAVTINMHIGSGQAMSFTSPEAPIEVGIVTMPMSLVQCASDLTFSPILQKYPDIRFALSEGGIGWIPYFKERADFSYGRHNAWTRQHKNLGSKLPSEVFDEHVYTCFLDDKFGIASRQAVNLDKITFEVDYPHSDCLWPNCPEILWDSLDGCSDEDIDKITYTNALKAYSWDPFSIRKKEDCTVGALRAESPGVSTEMFSAGGIAPSEKEAGPVTGEDFFQQMAKLRG